MDDPDQPIHWLVAVLVPEDQVLPLSHAVEALLSLSRTDARLPELHGADLFGGKNDWAGVDPAERVRIYGSALRLLAEHDCVIAHASIDKTKLSESVSGRTTPHLLALQFLVEKIDAYLRSQKDPIRQRALLVADETNEHEAFAIGMVAGMQATGLGIVPGRIIGQVIDTVHFVRSDVNRGVQLADLVAYALNRVTRAKRAGAPSGRGDSALVDMCTEYVWPLVRTYRQRWPS